MKPPAIAHLVAFLLLLSSCELSREDPRGAAESGPQLGREERAFLGQPMGHWIEQATRELGPEDPARTVEALTLALGSDDLEVIVSSADALETMGPGSAAAAPELASKLDHVQPWIRIACMEALTSIGAAAVPALLDTVSNGPGNAPIRAVIVLGNLGPEGRAAVPELKRLRAEGPENLRGRASEALALIAAAETAAGPGEPGDSAPAGRTAALVAAPAVAATAGDWSQFHGPGRDSICPERGLLTDWSDRAPSLLWKVDGLGSGYSSVSIASGRLFTMGDRTPSGGEKAQFVIALDLASRAEIWSQRIGGPHADGGPRSTPTVDGELVYALGTDGTLLCLEADSGVVRWQKSLPGDFGGRMMSGWKYCESPLVDGSRLVCTPGGSEATLVALAKESGDVLWRCALPELGERGKDGAGYSSMVVAEIDGVRQVVQLLGRGVVGVEADTGRFLWGYNRVANSTANITSPVVRGRHVFASTAYGTGSALLEIEREGDGFRAKEVYFLNASEFQNHHGGVVLVGDHIYGGHGSNRGAPTCIELATGRIAWRGKAPERGSAAVLYADGHVLFRYDRGLVALVEARPDACRLAGTFMPETGDGPAWAHPVIQDGRLYLRHGDLLLCYDLRRTG